MIYNVFGDINQGRTLFCPDQATIDQGKALKFEGVYVIGGQADADALLATYRQSWINNNQNLFNVSKDIDPDPVQTTWVICNLNTEAPNDNVDYNVFDVVDGRYTTVTGLDSAKLLFTQMQARASEWFIPGYIAWDTYPVVKQPTAEGVQTL